MSLFFGVLGSAVLIALAATLAGALAGFVFGIPKTVSAGTTTGSSIAAGYQGNTNLEQISDWLTKILVGAGLVELRGIYDALKAFGSGFSKSGALGPLGWIVAPALVVAYSVCGFLLAYLWARIYLTADLEQRAAAAAVAAVVAPTHSPPQQASNLPLPAAAESKDTLPAAGSPGDPGTAAPSRESVEPLPTVEAPGTGAPTAAT